MQPLKTNKTEKLQIEIVSPCFFAYGSTRRLFEVLSALLSVCHQNQEVLFAARCQEEARLLQKELFANSQKELIEYEHARYYLPMYRYENTFVLKELDYQGFEEYLFLSRVRTLQC